MSRRVCSACMCAFSDDGECACHKQEDALAQGEQRNVTATENSILREAAIASGKMVHKAATEVKQEPEHKGCACRWDNDDNRVATCVRHQGWLDVVSEWSNRAKEAEAKPSHPAPVNQALLEALKQIEELSACGWSAGIARAAIAAAEGKI